VPEHKHDYWLKDVTESILTPGDELLIFQCTLCPKMLPIPLSSLIKREGDGALSTSEESS
jgi:hypothetical protein